VTLATKKHRGEKFSIRIALLCGLVLLATIVLLHAEGRSFICTCGRFAVWTGEWCGSNTSQQLFDPYSFTHILHGFLFFWLIALVLTLWIHDSLLLQILMLVRPIEAIKFWQACQ